MNCSNCGAPIKEGNNFCTQCGSKVSDNTGMNYPSYPIDDVNADSKPAFAIQTDRSLLMYVLLSIVTCGIYSFYFIYTLARDVNEICKEDNQQTGGLGAFILFSILTCGFYGLYWEYKIANRLAENGPRYGLNFQENGTSVLVWHLFGILLCGIGPFVAMNIIIKNTNRLAMEYNKRNGLY